MYNITNQFLADGCDVYYGIGLIKKYLVLNWLSNINNITSKNKYDAFMQLLKDNSFLTSIISNFNFYDSKYVDFHMTDHRKLYTYIDTKLKQKLIEGKINTHKFKDNWFIFPEKLLELDTTIDIKDTLELILNEDGKSTVYNDLYKELKTNNYITDDIITIIDSILPTNDEQNVQLMDHITILKILYINYKNQTKSSILFHGGAYHSENYASFISEYTKNNKIEKFTFKTDSPARYLAVHQDNLTYLADEYNIPIFKNISYRDAIELSLIDKIVDTLPISYDDSTKTMKQLHFNGKYQQYADIEYLSKCKSTMNRWNDVSGGQTYQTQLMAPLQRKLDALERAELAELRWYFKDIDILEYTKNILDAAQVNKPSMAESIPEELKEVDLTGGLAKNSWMHFLLR